MKKAVIRNVPVFKLFVVLIFSHFYSAFSQETDSLQKEVKEPEDSVKTLPVVKFDSTKSRLRGSLEYEIIHTISKRIYKNFYEVRFRITCNREGLITKIKLIQSSGSRRIDNKIIKIIKNAQPYEKLPPDYESDTIEIDLRVAGGKRSNFYNY